MAGEVFGERLLRQGMSGDDVKELQIRLAGFKNATVPNGTFSAKTKSSVMAFQRDFMGITPSGVADRQTFDATDTFAIQYPIFTRFQNTIKCPCNDPACQTTNNGFGHNDFNGQYRSGKPQIEAYHQKEYLGIHRMLLWAVRAVFFYHPQYNWTLNSGYRCRIDNQARGRQSTNHMGKAIDIDPGGNTECDDCRRRVVEKMNAQIGWNNSNKKALEPARIAPTWVHFDVRTLGSQYLTDEYFVTNETDLNQSQVHTETENSEEVADEPLLDSQETVIQKQDARGYETSIPTGATTNNQIVTQNTNYGWEDIAQGVYEYITTDENYELKANCTGTVIVSPGVPTPAAGPLAARLNFNPENTLLQFLKNTTYVGLAQGGVDRFFTGLNQWLNTPPFTIGLSPTTGPLAALSIVPPDPGTGPGLHGFVSFPAVIAQGKACANQIANTSFSDDSKTRKREVWEIMNKYIKLALNMNVIAPIPTVGSLPSPGPGPYTGVTLVTYAYE